MKKSANRRALLTSGLSLILCVTTLLGSTFAWFTDSVEVKNNIIQSGNLDVVLEYKNDWADEWKTVDETSKIFDGNALWEPGHTEVAFLRVSNAGSLALKYNLNVNVYKDIKSTNVYGEEFSLADYIEVGYYRMDESLGQYLIDAMFGTREAALSNVTTAKLSADASIACSDAPVTPGVDTAQIVAMVVTMPTSVGNEANHKTGVAAPSIEFGINLLATQYTHESDSFGSDYDADATYPEVKKSYVTTAGEFVEALSNLENNGTITLLNDIVLGDVDIVLQDWTVTGTTEENGATVNVVDYANKVYNIDLGGYELSATDHAIELHGGTLNIKNGTISMNSETQDGTFITVGGHSPVYDDHKVAKCGQEAYNPASVLNLENVTFVGRSAEDGGFATSGHAIYVTCHGQVHIRDCTFNLVMENGVYANPFDVYNNASDGVGDGSGFATVVYVYEGTKFYGDPTYQAWKDAVNTDWEVNGGIRVYIADGYKLEAAPIADGDAYAWYTVVAE